MRKVVLTLCCVVGMLAPMMAQEWYQLSSAEGAFTAYFPARPEYRPVSVGQGKYWPRWVLETPAGSFFVDYSDLRLPPEEVARAGGVEELLDRLSHASSAIAFFHTILSVRRITYGGYPAREMVVQATGLFPTLDREMVHRHRHMIVGDRYYHWSYQGRPGTQDGADVQRFLDSLVIERR